MGARKRGIGRQYEYFSVSVPHKMVRFLRKAVIGKKDPNTRRKPKVGALFMALALTQAERIARAQEAVGILDPLLAELIQEERKRGWPRSRRHPPQLFRDSLDEPQPVRRIRLDSSKRSE